MKLAELAAIDALEGLTLEDLQVLVELLEDRRVPPGEQLIEQGHRTPVVLMLLEGELEVTRDEPTGSVTASVPAHEWVGVVDAIDERGATAGVRARTQARCLLLPRPELDAMLEAGHPTAARLLRSWIRSLGQQLARVNRGNEAMLKLAARLGQPE